MYVDPRLTVALLTGQINMADYWLGLTLLVPLFLALVAIGEVYAIAVGKSTYTGWIRRQLGLSPVEPRRVWAAPLFALLLGGFLIWFLPHILLGVWPS